MDIVTNHQRTGRAGIVQIALLFVALFGHSLTLAAACASADAKKVSILTPEKEAPTTTPSADVRPPKPRSMPPGFHFTARFVPAGFIESKAAQATTFSSGASAAPEREAPGFFRVYLQEKEGQRPEFIVIVAEKAGRNDTAIRPNGRREARKDPGIRRGTDVFVSSSKGWDLRWTEAGVDMKVMVQAPSLTEPQIKQLVAGIQIS